MSSFVKNFKPFSFTSKSSTVRIRYRVLVIALFEARISTQILILCSPVGTISNGFSQGVVFPVTPLMMSSFSNRLSSSFTLSRKANGIYCSLWSTGDSIIFYFANAVLKNSLFLFVYDIS